MTMNLSKTLSRQRGVTLPELLIYIGVITLIGVFFLARGAGIIGSTRLEQAHQELQAAIIASQIWRSVKGDYTDISVENLVDGGFSLHGFTDGAAENAYGADLIITPATGNGDAEVDYQTDTAPACEQLEVRIVGVPGIKSTPAPDCTAAFLLEFTID